MPVIYFNYTAAICFNVCLFILLASIYILPNIGFHCILYIEAINPLKIADLLKYVILIEKVVTPN